VKVGPKKPNMNAFAERFLQTVKQECLDHFVICCEAHLRHLLKEFLEHYHLERAHQGLDNRTPTGRPPPTTADFQTDQIECRERLGGLLKSYHRKAA
jgi:putative transposase